MIKNVIYLLPRRKFSLEHLKFLLLRLKYRLPGRICFLQVGPVVLSQRNHVHKSFSKYRHIESLAAMVPKTVMQGTCRRRYIA